MRGSSERYGSWNTICTLRACARRSRAVAETAVRSRPSMRMSPRIGAARARRSCARASTCPTPIRRRRRGRRRGRSRSRRRRRHAPAPCRDVIGLGDPARVEHRRVRRPVARQRVSRPSELGRRYVRMRADSTGGQRAGATTSASPRPAASCTRPEGRGAPAARVALLHDPARAHHVDAIAERRGEVQVVRDEEHAHAATSPAARRARAMISACVVTSSAVVGSSQTSSRGELVSAPAIMTRCSIPPESSCGN